MYSDNFLSSPAARCIKSTLSVSGSHSVKRSVFLSIPQTEKIPAPPIRRAGCEAPRPEKGEGDSRGEEERRGMSGGVNISGAALGIARAAYGRNVQRLCVITVIVFFRCAAAINASNSPIKARKVPITNRAKHGAICAIGYPRRPIRTLNATKMLGSLHVTALAEWACPHLGSLSVGWLCGAHGEQFGAVRITNIGHLAKQQRANPRLRLADVIGNFGLCKASRLQLFD